MFNRARTLLGPGSVLTLAVWFGLVTGVVEVAILWGRIFGGFVT